MELLLQLLDYDFALLLLFEVGFLSTLKGRLVLLLFLQEVDMVLLGQVSGLEGLDVVLLLLDHLLLLV